ncbi:SMI1/KNR4 family protein [Pseudovibrio exalbescens]|uniref:SMI1/KNR4 family protein n=1 Tax=Pseudovibrio exalbescens TaxID=197461 RepID=UPI002365307A|nr:SMI1/KNR4 family protein [Pseudovibrio exalbescens]MDD7911538.1 SMI1/KNR4 family protein [Pseudovibrio exalbescens]
MTSLNDLEQLIAEYSGNGVEFGNSSSDLSPTDERVAETESKIGCKLPPSYLWFVKNYGGGHVYGEEIFAIYPVLSDLSVGDIAYQTKAEREQGFVGSSAVVICSNDFGETFYFDTSARDNEGEYPVFVKAGATEKKYADSFAGFLYKRISDPEA